MPWCYEDICQHDTKFKFFIHIRDTYYIGKKDVLVCSWTSVPFFSNSTSFRRLSGIYSDSLNCQSLRFVTIHLWYRLGLSISSFCIHSFAILKRLLQRNPFIIFRSSKWDRAFLGLQIYSYPYIRAYIIILLYTEMYGKEQEWLYISIHELHNTRVGSRKVLVESTLTFSRMYTVRHRVVAFFEKIGLI